MPPIYHWDHPHGHETLQNIVKKTVPKWKNGLRENQLKYVPAILDCKDVLCVEVTGGGKSAAFSVPILIHNEVSANPSLYPHFSSRKFAVGVIVTPTKGLAGDIVKELRDLRISALAYTPQRKTEARKNGENLAKEIISCTRWQLTFATNLIYACAEEGHLLYEWGLSFRKAFGFVGVYFRGILPSTISIFTLSATLPPGEHTRLVCKNLGFTRDNFITIRNSNERKNIEISFEPLQNAVSGKSFPQLLQYIIPKHKTIIHCSTIDQVLRVFLYLWNSLLRTLTFFDAFAYTVSETVQRIGRVGRILEMATRAVVLVQPRQVTAAQKQLSGKKKKDKHMEQAKARVITEEVCLVAAFNREFQLSEPNALLDCHDASRHLYCSLCRTRYTDYSADFPTPTYPADAAFPPPFLTPIAPAKSKSLPKYSKEHRAMMEQRLRDFGHKIWRENYEKTEYSHLPKLAFFPSSVSKLVLTHLHSINETSDLLNIIGPQGWRFSFEYGSDLVTLVSEIRDLLPKRKGKGKGSMAKGSQSNRKRRRADSSSDEDARWSADDNSDLEDDPMEHSVPSSPRRPPPKRQILTDVTNTLPLCGNYG
ncbi:P-loop containing nucleoside triphosphate hydrolase protein [Hymenopellis radicata]|nr:P-loop containing nucleoside triphosphate hydrolase protein [Hymenopellis radicata]